MKIKKPRGVWIAFVVLLSLTLIPLSRVLEKDGEGGEISSSASGQSQSSSNFRVVTDTIPFTFDESVVRNGESWRSWGDEGLEWTEDNGRYYFTAPVGGKVVICIGPYSLRSQLTSCAQRAH
jgi:hypothetical protein